MIAFTVAVAVEVRSVLSVPDVPGVVVALRAYARQFTWPVLPRAGEYVAFLPADNPRPRRVASVNYDADGEPILWLEPYATTVTDVPNAEAFWAARSFRPVPGAMRGAWPAREETPR